jgi:Fe-S-cluster containining protein
MSSDPQNPEEKVTVNVELGSPEWRLQTTMSVPKEPIVLKEMLPLVQSFADAVVGSAARAAEEGGKKISCKKGCGACCRQPVPLSETEAHWIRDLVDRLPPSRQTEIRARFAQARQRLAEAGLLEKLLHPESWDKGEGWAVAMSYFRLGIPCPFLENEACSIHPDRPLKCREYLVTSPAENCRKPTADNIKMVALPFQMWMAIARLDNASPGDRRIPWVPLVLALEWAELHSETTEPRPGHEVLKQFFELLSSKNRSQEQDALNQSC